MIEPGHIARNIWSRLTSALIFRTSRSSICARSSSAITHFPSTTTKRHAYATMAPTTKLHGRAFYESIGSPKYIVAPMVDQSEFAWRLLTRSFLPAEQRSTILAYSPMFHAKLFAESSKYRAQHFEPLRPPLILPDTPDPDHEKTFEKEDIYLDGNPAIDRPLFVQFCANEPAAFLAAAKIVQPYCDAVDLNLGCPQGIARRGNYGAFLQEDWATIGKLISTLHEGLDIPVTAKFRIQETREKTLEYAKMILAAGASIITVHGRQRHQKGHATGLADWSVIRYLREQLPKDTVIFANGNVLQHADLQRCLDATGADGVMSAEGNLYDPALFAAPPPENQEVEGREYWRGRDGRGGYRCDAVLRRYLDIIHEHVLRQAPPAREPLFLASETAQAPDVTDGVPSNEPGAGDEVAEQHDDNDGGRPAKRQKLTGDSSMAAEKSAEQQQPPPPPPKQQKKAKPEKCTNPNLTAMQAHCFHILRALVGVDVGVRDALARCRAGDLAAYEHVLTLTEAAVKKGLLAYASDPAAFEDDDDAVALQDEEAATTEAEVAGAEEVVDSEDSSAAAVKRCKRPFWICQSRIRPLPKEAMEKGSLQLSKKELAKRKAEEEAKAQVGLHQDGAVEVTRVPVQSGAAVEGAANDDASAAAEKKDEVVEVAKEGLVCG